MSSKTNITEQINLHKEKLIENPQYATIMKTKCKVLLDSAYAVSYCDEKLTVCCTTLQESGKCTKEDCNCCSVKGAYESALWEIKNGMREKSTMPRITSNSNKISIGDSLLTKLFSGKEE